MTISDLIDLNLIHINVSVSSKKRALEIISESIHQQYSNLELHHIFDQFIKREKLGTTAIGHGVALPHARIDGNEKTIGVYVSLKNAIDFNAMDGEPVNQIFALIVPEHANDEHLKLLSQLAAFFRDPNNRKALLAEQSREAVYERFKSFRPS